MAVPRIVGEPRPGFFKLRLVRGGPFVPAAIYMPCPIDPDFGFPLDRSRHLTAAVDGKDADPHHVWVYGREITPDEFLYLTELSAWARAHAPSDPAANPRQPINLNTLAPVTP